MMQTELRISYRLFPYERRFLKREISALGGKVLKLERPDTLVSNLDPAIASQLTYIRWINDGNFRQVFTEQAKRETKAKGTQDTRYGPHGLHEFKGKFNPQTPRSLILQNYRRWNKAWPIMDPFMGSGTTLIEARHLGFLSEGIELNPLAVLISRAKLDWEKEPEVASIDYHDAVASTPYEFDIATLDYLKKWFPSQTLCEILKLLTYISHFPEPELRIAEVILSNHLRDYSWQDPGDLRIRRRGTIPQQQSLISAFINDFNHSLECRKNWARGRHTDLKISSACHNGNSTKMSQLRGRGTIAGTVCSPPYATALPYIDTYRLSLVVLNLIKPGELNGFEQTLIGARDIDRLDHELFDERLGTLPRKCKDFINGLRRKTDGDTDAGFRKRALPFALARYFFEMSIVFDELRHVEEPGSPNLWVIGTNRTRLLELEIIIPTPQLLGHVAKAAGFKHIRFERLDAYGRYDIHSKNSIRSETLLSFDG